MRSHRKPLSLSLRTDSERFETNATPIIEKCSRRNSSAASAAQSRRQRRRTDHTSATTRWTNAAWAIQR
jgi:hypothetical protein